ncbi:MAG TPA: hypothetical protein VJ992_13010 [Gemmatimonadales bacterium]|nr:hypothetical protein [Gemmatimonadales bacterium]
MSLELDLTTHEQEILREMLEQHLSDLRMEIADTERMEFRDMLKERKEVIRKILDVLPATTPRG